MKFKFRNLFFGVLAIISACVFVGCKDKDETPEETRVNPTVSVVVEQRDFYVGDKLSSIEILLGDGSTAGTVAWTKPSKELSAGNNKCEWKFVPADKNTYFEKTGSVTLVGLDGYSDPVVGVSVVNEKIYAENKLSSVELDLSAGSTTGIIEWVLPDTVLTSGDNVCKWKFVPENTTSFKTVFGNVTLNAVEQRVVSLAIKTNPETTTFNPYRTTNLAGMVLTATYDGGKVQDVTSGWTVGYENGESFTMADTKVFITYEDVTIELAVTMEKIGLNNPQIIGTYVYNGEPQTAVVRQTAYSKYYVVSENTYTDAGTYQVKCTITDVDNVKWNNADTEVLYLTFVINEQELSVSREEFDGVYDGNAHPASVSAEHSTNIYYSTEPLTKENYATLGQPELIEYVNAGEYKIYYYIVAETNYKDASGQLTVSIAKAEQAANVKYTYAVLSENNVNIPLSYVESKDVVGEDFDLTDKVTFVYYTNYSKKIKTTTASGATASGLAPKNMGTYYVETTILGDDNYEDAIIVSRLVIAPDDCFLACVGEEWLFAWRSADGDEYGELTKTTENDFVELMLKSRFDGVLHDGRVYMQDSVWFVEYEDLGKTYKIERQSGDKSITFVNEDESEYATLEKWTLPYYIGTFTHSSGATITIYNDIGLIRYTFTSTQTNTRGGLVQEISSNKLSFYEYVGEVNYGKYFNDTPAMDLSKRIDKIQLVKNGIVAISGEYVRVS